MTSAYLDSDSEHELGCDSDSSDADLPITDVCSPSKQPRLTEVTREREVKDPRRLTGEGGVQERVMSSDPVEPSTLDRKPLAPRPPASPTVTPFSPVGLNV